VRAVRKASSEKVEDLLTRQATNGFSRMVHQHAFRSIMIQSCNINEKKAIFVHEAQNFLYHRWKFCIKPATLIESLNAILGT
jgi:hypothetical protein